MIDIKKNPETVGKLKVGTSSATPADGEIIADKVGVGTAPIADSKLDIAGAGTQRLYVRETGSTVKTKLLTTTSKGAVGTETNHPLELQTNDQTRVTIDSTGKTTSKAADNVFTVQDTEDTVADANAEVRIGESDASGNLNNYWGLKFAGTASGGDLDVNRNGTTALTIDSSGNVNISGLAASSDVQTDGSKNLITSSDKRLKNDIGELTAGLNIISNLQPRYFSWKSDETNTQQLGFYAQDVYEFLPEAAPREQKQNLVTSAVAAQPATYYEEGDELPDGKAVGDEKTPAVEAVEAVFEPVTNEDGSPDYNWGFNGRPIIAALVAAVKELKLKVEALEGAE